MIFSKLIFLTACVGSTSLPLPSPAPELDSWKHSLQGDRYCPGDFSKRERIWVILDQYYFGCLIFGIVLDLWRDSLSGIKCYQLTFLKENEIQDVLDFFFFFGGGEFWTLGETLRQATGDFSKKIRIGNFGSKLRAEGYRRVRMRLKMDGSGPEQRNFIAVAKIINISCRRKWDQFWAKIGIFLQSFFG